MTSHLNRLHIGRTLNIRSTSPWDAASTINTRARSPTGTPPARIFFLFSNRIRLSNSGSTSPLDDYRRFFRFEVQIRQDERVVGTLSERRRSGSGGEHRAPLYVIAGAALAAAYGKSEAWPGGIGLILLDEFGGTAGIARSRIGSSRYISVWMRIAGSSRWPPA